MTIDSQLPIDTILMTSNRPVDVLEVKDKVAKENTVPDENGQIIKTFKCNDSD